MIKRPTYDNYDEYIIDYETTNTSFIAVASILRRRGVKNYNFFLKLYDEDLQGVDPHDPNLSTQLKFKIAIECRRNFWYFIREVMIIPGVGKYKLNRGNLAVSWCCLNNIPAYLIMPRQHGKTWAIIAYGLWAFNFASEYTSFLFMNKQLKDSQLNLKRLKDARAELPEYLRNDKIQTSKGELKDAKASVNSLENALKNRIDVKASARNEMQADELGRGMTVAWVWIDEIAFLQFNRTIYAAMIPAWGKAAEVAKSKGRPIGLILTTTPSDLSLDMGKFAYEIKSDAAEFNETLYNMDSADVNEWLNKNSRNGYIFIEYNYKQLGHLDPEEWFADQCKKLLYNWPKIRREVLLQWLNASSNSPFNQDDLRDLRAMIMNSLDTESITINKYYKLNVYRKLEPLRKYIISVDPSKGRGERADRTVVMVIDAQTDECCAIFKSPTIQYKETYRFIYTLYYQYIPNSVIVVENNIDTLIEYIKDSPMRHALYYEPTKSVINETRKQGGSVQNKTTHIVYGIATTSDNRPKYFDILFEMVRTEKEKLCCKELVEEIETLEYKTPTRIEAVTGMHDDVVMAYLIGVYVKRFGKNRPRFGLYYYDGLTEKPKNVSEYTFAHENDPFLKLINSHTKGNAFYENLADRTRYMAEDNHREEYARIDNERRAMTKEEKLDSMTNVFGSTVDSSGTKSIRSTAFYDLNARQDSKSSGDDIFGGGNRVSTSKSIFDDDDTSSWF